MLLLPLYHRHEVGRLESAEAPAARARGWKAVPGVHWSSHSKRVPARDSASHRPAIESERSYEQDTMGARCVHSGRVTIEERQVERCSWAGPEKEDCDWWMVAPSQSQSKARARARAQQQERGPI